LCTVAGGGGGGDDDDDDDDNDDYSCSHYYKYNFDQNYHYKKYGDIRQKLNS
jgi:hypothetical protein